MQTIFPAVAGLIAGGIIEFFVIALLMPMLTEVGAVRKNYLGIQIPVSAGVSFSITTLAVFCIFGCFSWLNTVYYVFLLGIISISFLGFIDDILGQRDTLGFKGHFGALFKGRLTTGGLKALGGGLVAFFLALFLAGSWYDVVLNTLIIALFANMLNLLDLRPGRAVKGFLFFFTIIVAITFGKLDWQLITPILGIIIVYFPYDLKAKAMMGDSGSNVLGLILGYMCASYFPLTMRIGTIVLLVLIHIYTEKYSLTETIERNSFLRFLDRWGRE